jgi:glucose/mannose-6-phosphate isomerase
MMNLDDLSRMQQIDSMDMINEIDHLPDQIQQAIDIARNNTLPAWTGFENILISGMGGSAIAGDLLAAYLADICPLPILSHRDYGIPAWVSAKKTLVIACSHSGNTEETLSTFEAAKTLGCRIVAVTTGGKLATGAKAAGFPVWTFEHKGQPRSAVGFGFVLLISILARLGLIPDPEQDLKNAVELMCSEQGKYQPASPVNQNPAKRQAGQMVGRTVTIVGSGILAPLGRRWKGQINELAKALAFFDVLPEADHNSMAGTTNPEAMLEKSFTMFLQSDSDHPRNAKRSRLTQNSYMLNGICTDSYKTPGKTKMEQIWTTLHFGDYVAYYLAILYEIDPTPIEAIQQFKQEMG